MSWSRCELDTLVGAAADSSRRDRVVVVVVAPAAIELASFSHFNVTASNGMTALLSSFRWRCLVLWYFRVE